MDKVFIFFSFSCCRTFSPEYLFVSIFLSENTRVEALDKALLLAISWDRKIQVSKLVKSELKVVKKWDLESPAIGLVWLDDQVCVLRNL